MPLPAATAPEPGAAPTAAGVGDPEGCEEAPAPGPTTTSPTSPANTANTAAETLLRDRTAIDAPTLAPDMTAPISTCRAHAKL
ncbi:MAG: hypothetical protein Q7J48_20500, partial [Nocardioides sp.]|nr:hypothetical protein [Nocardioides sp.]